jgi:hypothetical protein
MTAPNPSQNLQVVGPGEPAPVPQAPTPDYVDPLPAEDRILSPEETESFFSHGTLTPPTEETVAQVEQVAALIAADVQAPATPPQAVQPMPGQPTPAQIQQSVDQTQQQVSQPQQVQPVTPPLGPLATPVPGAPAVAPVVPGTVPQPAQQSPQEVALAAQVQQLTGQVQNLMGQIQQQPQPAQPAQPGQPQGTDQQQQQFNMQIPPQHMAALGGEDPALATQAMNQIINGVAQTVYQQAMGDMDRRLEAYTPEVQRQVSAAQQQGEIKRDMYGTYPELSGMMSQVAAVAEQMTQSGQSNGQWSPDLRDQIAERLAPMVPGLAEKVQQNRNARYGQQVQVPQYQQTSQLLPQVPQSLPPGVVPTQVIGGAHVPSVPQQQAPMYVRDAAGNITQVHPQQYQQVAGPQARPGMQGQVDPMLQDIWNTLGYRT